MLIADVSGFTALTEALGGQGSAGVELLTKCMNRYFTKVGWPAKCIGPVSNWPWCMWWAVFVLVDGLLSKRYLPYASGHSGLFMPVLNAPQVIDLLLLYGGDVEKFAGDSMIVVFVPTPEEAEGVCRLPECVQQGLQGFLRACLPIVAMLAADH